ncbi:hypothetical protein EsH8_IX_000954 [Colletotrichum jinshuiense]
MMRVSQSPRRTVEEASDEIPETMPEPTFHVFPNLPNELKAEVIEALMNDHHSPSVASQEPSTCPNLNPWLAQCLSMFYTSRATVANVCLTSRLMRSIAEPILYRHFCLHQYWLRGSRYSVDMIEVLAGFVATLHERPQLARMVRQVEIIETCDPDFESYMEFGQLPERLRKRLRISVIDASPSNVPYHYDAQPPTMPDDWADMPISLSLFAGLVQFLIIMSRSIELLKLEIASGHYGFSWIPFGRDMKNSWPIPTLKGFRIRHNGNKRIIASDFVSLEQPEMARDMMLPLFCPNLVDLDLDVWTHVDELTAKLANIRFLAVRDVFMHQRDFRNLVKMCVGLETFIYQSVSRRATEEAREIMEALEELMTTQIYGAEREITPREMQESLMEQKDTLKYLEICRGTFPT